METARQSFHRATLGHSDFSLAERTFDIATMDTGSSQIDETFEAENVKAGQLFGICIQVTTHRAGYLFSKVVY